MKDDFERHATRLREARETIELVGLLARRGKLSTEIVPVVPVVPDDPMIRRKVDAEIEEFHIELEKKRYNLRGLAASSGEASAAEIERFGTLRLSANRDQMRATGCSQAEMDAYNTSVTLERDIEIMEGEVRKYTRYSFRYYRTVRILSEAKQRLDKFENPPAKKARPAKKAGGLNR